MQIMFGDNVYNNFVHNIKNKYSGIKIPPERECSVYMPSEEEIKKYYEMYIRPFLEEIIKNSKFSIKYLIARLLMSKDRNCRIISKHIKEDFKDKIITDKTLERLISIDAV